MIPFDLAVYLSSAFLLLIFGMTLTAYSRWCGLGAQRLLHENHTAMVGLVLFCLIISVVIGLRPPSGMLFGDSVNYARTFNATGLLHRDSSTSVDEWLFLRIMQMCRTVGDVNLFFIVIDLGYIFFALWGIRRLCRGNAYAGMLFFFGAFSFFTYGVNGIRNGLACSIMIAAISYLVAEKRSVRDTVIGAVLGLAAFSIHKSTMLPMVCVVVAMFYRNVKGAFIFWLFSIVLFLVAHNAIELFFMGLGFDDRLSNYITSADSYAAEGYKTGFRADFLIYSFMPILLGLYVCLKRKIKDPVFERLLVTYILANSFWVMLMGASFSNRFAYLSWFLYPVVLAYPCFRMDVWGRRQGRIGGRIMIANVGFTLLMHFFYY